MVEGGLQGSNRWGRWPAAKAGGEAAAAGDIGWRGSRVAGWLTGKAREAELGGRDALGRLRRRGDPGLGSPDLGSWAHGGWGRREEREKWFR